jgi:SAM-dependent methyltransferase
MVMKPRDLVDFTKRNYSTSRTLEIWNRKRYLERGLNPDEIHYLEKIPEKRGQLLLLGLGGGREAVPLAKMGFDVTGVDFVPEMVERAKEHALKHGVRISGLVQDMSNLEVPENRYDVIWLSSFTYSLVPTRAGRINLLRKIQDSLAPGGYFVCEFMWKKPPEYPAPVRLTRKLFSILTLGNLSYEKGDMLWNNEQFIHAFFSEENIRSEFNEVDLEIIDICFKGESLKGGAVLRKSVSSPS